MLCPLCEPQHPCQACVDRVQRDDGALDRIRKERRERMQRDMETCMAEAEELTAFVAKHPRPWTWSIAFHDGYFYQFFDANGRPCLGNDLRDPEDAAALLMMINRN